MKLMERVLGWLYPNRCICCRQVIETAGLCPACEGKVNFLTDTIFLKAEEERHWLSQVEGVCAYDDLSRQAVVTLKFAGRSGVARGMASLMVERYRNAMELKDWLVVPVPLHPKRQKERGFNQSQLLAENICKETGLIMEEKALRRIRNTKPQSSLAHGYERTTNLKDAFQADQKLVEGRHILLIDDVATTGHTLAECAKALRGAGAVEVSALVFAHPIYK